VSVERPRAVILASILLALPSACREPNPAYSGGDGGDRPPASGVACEADRDLAACFRFEGSPRDESSNNLAIATARSLLYEAGLDGLALSVGPGSRLQVGNTTALDATRLTIEVWLKPRTLPTGTARAGIIDYERQYSLWVLPGGAVMCSVRGPGDLTAMLDLKPGVWTSVACTLDNATLTILRDGVPHTNRAFTTVETPSGNGGMAIGSNVVSSDRPNVDSFDGLIDNLRIWRRAHTQPEICAAALTCN
jgi:Concanavalin A-like lectin/glucanases superfamily